MNSIGTEFSDVNELSQEANHAKDFLKNQNSLSNKETFCKDPISNKELEDDEAITKHPNPHFAFNDHDAVGIQNRLAFPEAEDSKFIDSRPMFSSDSKQEVNVEIERDDEDTVCGIGPFRPQWLQRWATPRSYLLLYTLIAIIQGSYSSYFVGILSTLEKRFSFKSKTSGVILMVDEVTPFILGIFVGYLGGKSHRPRILCLGMWMHILCCLLSTSPYLIYGSSKHLTSLDAKNETGPQICDTDLKNKCDLDEGSPTMVAVLLLIFAHFLKGFGNITFYSVGLSYMDDNAKKKNTPVYLGITIALRMLGPLVGYLMSSAFLKYYENPFDDPGFGVDDPRWIGGWWMGFLLQAALLFIITIPMFLFPRRLPSHRKPKEKREEKESGSLRDTLSDLCKSVKRLLKNPMYVCLVVVDILAITFGTFGHYIVLPKYMEHQFKLSASDASLYSGPPGLAAIMVSTMLGSLAIWKYKPSAKVILAGMVATELIATAGFLLLMIPQCKSVEMSHFGIDDNGLILENSCNFKCNCTTEIFTPVCGSDGETTYFSPCYAGCSAERTLSSSSDGKKVYEDCSCVSDVVVEGVCADEDCWSRALPYIVAWPILQAITHFLHVFHLMLLLRSVHPDDKTIALGTFEALICLFGLIPYLLIFGTVVDTACIVWKESCGESGNCWHYDMNKFNKLLHGSSSLFSFLAALVLFVMYFMSNRVRNLYDDDEGTESNVKDICELKSLEKSTTTKL